MGRLFGLLASCLIGAFGISLAATASVDEEGVRGTVGWIAIVLALLILCGVVAAHLHRRGRAVR